MSKPSWKPVLHQDPSTKRWKVRETPEEYILEQLDLPPGDNYIFYGGEYFALEGAEWDPAYVAGQVQFMTEIALPRFHPGEQVVGILAECSTTMTRDLWDVYDWETIPLDDIMLRINERRPYSSRPADGRSSYWYIVTIVTVMPVLGDIMDYLAEVA